MSTVKKTKKVKKEKDSNEQHRAIKYRLEPTPKQKEFFEKNFGCSLALTNSQINLETAFTNFFNNPSSGFPKFKSKKHTKKSYTTNLVNGNIELYDDGLKLHASSQLCNHCGYKNPLLKDLRIRSWTCPVCGVHHDRDINATINILQEGLHILSKRREEKLKEREEAKQVNKK